METLSIPPLVLTISAATAYSALSRSRLYALMQSGELPSVRVGGRRLIRRDALDAFFAKLTETEDKL
ncbi:helix-turn-helix domain-containing protein [Brevundimonas sp.]|uniref:helix-turn-helix domain-containing protein n=1 Tax=Pseudomonadota TaxID=1224 RepID=UPI0039180649